MPAWGGKLILLVLVAGFFVALFVAWAFELTPQGIKRESEVDRSQSITSQTGRKLDRAIIVFLVLVLAALADGLFIGTTGALMTGDSDALVYSIDGRRSLVRSDLPRADLPEIEDVPGVADVGTLGVLLTTATAATPLVNCRSANSTPGSSSEKNEAASMMPAAKLSRPSSRRSDRFRIGNTPSAPTPVPRPANRLARKPIQIISPVDITPSFHQY